MAFSALEERILKAVASMAGANRLTTEEVAEQVGCTPQTIYQRLGSNMEFRDAFKEALRASLVADAPGIIKKFTDVAADGSFKHTKLYFEMIGLHQDKQQIDLDASVKTEQPFNSEAEAVEFLEATLKKLAERKMTND